MENLKALRIIRDQVFKMRHDIACALVSGVEIIPFFQDIETRLRVVGFAIATLAMMSGEHTDWKSWQWIIEQCRNLPEEVIVYCCSLNGIEYPEGK